MKNTEVLDVKTYRQIMYHVKKSKIFKILYEHVTVILLALLVRNGKQVWPFSQLGNGQISIVPSVLISGL